MAKSSPTRRSPAPTATLEEPAEETARAEQARDDSPAWWDPRSDPEPEPAPDEPVSARPKLPAGTVESLESVIAALNTHLKTQAVWLQTEIEARRAAIRARAGTEETASKRRRDYERLLTKRYVWQDLVAQATSDDAPDQKVAAARAMESLTRVPRGSRMGPHACRSFHP
jgi:hypothetical protein